MTITFKESRELRKRIKKLVEAERGAQHPDDGLIINRELRVAKKRLNEFIESLRLPDGRIQP